MASKPNNFNVKSNRKCSVKGCKRYIKQNVLDRQPNADMCYPHYMKLIRKNPIKSIKYRADVTSIADKISGKLMP